MSLCTDTWSFYVYGVTECELPEITAERAAAFLRNHAVALRFEAGDDEGDPVAYLEEIICTLGHDSRDAQGSPLYAVARVVEVEKDMELFCDCDGCGEDTVIGCAEAPTLPWREADWGALSGVSENGFEALLDQYLTELYGPKTWCYGECHMVYA